MTQVDDPRHFEQPRMGTLGGERAEGHVPTPNDECARYEYHHLAAPWGTAKTVGRVLQRASEPREGFRATGTVPDRLRWTSDFLVLASRAISIVACVQGLDYPPDLHRTAQQDLWAWASYLDDHPSIAAEFDLASVEGRSDADRRMAGERATQRWLQSKVPSASKCGPTR
jgi:hypothetical protein